MSDDEVVDLTAAIEDPDNMPLCPLCDNAIVDWEPACLIFAHGCKCIAHTDCMISARQEIEEEEEE